MAPIIVFVEGNIGTGKTTFLKTIKSEKYKIQVLLEPVDEWIKSGMLGKFYEDPDTYDLMFQTYCLFTRLKQFEKIDKSMDYVFIERSIYCDCNVFAKVCLTQFNKYDKYMIVYNQFLELIKEMYDMPYYFLYLYKTPNECLKQIETRGRAEEDGITLDYLNEIHTYHENWLQTDRKFNNINYFCKISINVFMCHGDYDVRKKDCVNEILNEFIDITC